MSARPFTEELARRIAETPAAAIPTPAREASARILVDSIGVTLGGARSELADPLRRYLELQEVSGKAVILGVARRATTELAALVNAGFGAALDFDDVVSAMPAHPSVMMLAVALGSGRVLTGAALIEAHVIGLEAGVRLGRLMTLGHYDRGFHATGTLGIFSAVATLSRLEGLAPTQVQTALGIATSMASGLRRNFGTMTKPFLSGLAARNAVTAVRLAQCGFSAAPDAIEGRAGFAQAFGADQRGSDALDDWGSRWAVVDPGVSLRKFACYNANQRAMQGVLELRERLGLDAATLDRLECRMPPGGMQGAIHPRPRTGLEAKFSLQYVLAAGMLDSRYGLATFTDGAVNRPAIARLLKRVDAHEDPACRGDDPLFDQRTPGARGFVEVQAWARDGRQAVVRVDRPPGHPLRPLTWGELRDKFLDCAAYGGIAAPAAQQAVDRLRDLDACVDVRAVLAPLCTDHLH